MTKIFKNAVSALKQKQKTTPFVFLIKNIICGGGGSILKIEVSKKFCSDTFTNSKTKKSETKVLGTFYNPYGDGQPYVF